MVILSILLLATPNLVNAQNVDNTDTKFTPDALAKIGKGLRTNLDSANNDDKMNVLVLCEGLDTLNYILRARFAISGLSITNQWYALGAFSASINKAQLQKLAELPFVLSIDTEEGEVIPCLDSARAQTRVDTWTNENPTINGDLDGSLTSYSKDDVVIAVLDTGCDNDHVDLDGGKVLAFKDCVSGLDDFTPPIDAYDSDTTYGHGTHVSSIAAGTGEGYYGIYKGVAPGAALVIVRVLGGTLSDLTEGMNWVAANKATYGIEIVTMSLSVTGSAGDYDQYAQLADRLVYYYGLVVTCAQGNTPSGSIVRSPATGKYVIAVGNAIDPDESTSGNWELSEYSCHGPCDDGRKKPDVLAPGTNINAAKVGTSSGYHELSGTSMATPFVAGLCALWLDKDMSLKSPSYGLMSDPKVKNLLMASATDMPYDTNPGKDNYYGAGRIDAWTELLFYVYDVSSTYSNAPTVITYSWSDKHYYRYNEPLWAGDSSGMADWYKVLCYSGIFIYAQATGDPDLVLVISIWNKNLVKVAESYHGRVRNVGYWSTYKGTYYVKVEVYKDGNVYSGQVSGDYYDVHITTTLS